MYHGRVLLDLPEVTLVSVDTVCHDLTQLAVDECKKHIKFGDIKIFSNRPSNGDIRIDQFSSLEEAGNFTVYKLPSYIKTSHCLFIHYDSWVLDPFMWRSEFLNYDYIGAPWWYNDNMNVGNSGFCLRSLALMDFIASHKEEFPIVMPEDHTLCRKYQPLLPQFKWAPQEAAQDFSFERVKPSIDSRHFGFHGIFNWPFVLSYRDFVDRMKVARQTPYLQKSTMLNELDNLWFARWGALKTPIYRG